MKKSKQKFVLIIMIVSFLLAGAAIASLIYGPAGNLLSSQGHLSENTFKLILYNVRLPRVLLAIVAGVGLACSGLIFQAVLSNPLADPFVLGTSSGAATAAVLSIVLGVTSGLSMMLFGFVGGAVSLFMVMGIARMHGRYPLYRLIVSGIIVHSLFSAFIMLIISHASDKISGVTLWLMGNLGNNDLSIVILAGVIVAVCVAVLLLKHRELNLLTIGSEHAFASGVNVKRYRMLFLVIATVMTGVIVSISGIIGFVGIIVPHGMRLMLGANNKYLILTSAASGALFLLLADMVIRFFLGVNELPVGVVTALAGSPFFLYLLSRKNEAVI